MADGGTITYHFKGDDKDINSKLKKIGGIAKGVGVGLGAAFVAGTGVAIGAIANLTKQSVQSFAEYEQLEGGIESLFGKGSKEMANVMKMSEDAYKNLTMSQNEYLNAFQGTYSIMKNGMSENADAIQYTNKMIKISSDLYNTYGGSVEQYQGAINWALKGTYSYLDNLNIGIKGTKEGFIEAANKSGVLKKQIKDTSELTNDQIIDVIQHYTEAAGAFNKTQDEASQTIQGSMNMVKSSWENLITGFSKDGADVEKLLDQFISSAGTFVNNLFPVIERALTSLLNVLPKVLNSIVQKLPGTIQKLLPPLLTALTSLLQGVVAAIPVLLQVLVNALPMIISSLITMTLDVINALISMLPEMIPLLIQAILDAFLQILDHFDEILEAGIDLLLALVEGILAALPTLMEKMPMIILKMKTNLIRAVPRLIIAAWEIIWALIKGIVKYTPKLIAKMPGIIKDLVEELKSHVGKLFDMGKDLLKGLWNGIKDKKDWLLDKIGSIGKAIKDKVKKVLGISSPSKEFAILGRFSMLGYEEGLEDLQPEIQKKIDTIFSLSPNMVGGMNTLSPNVNVVVNNEMNMDPLGQVVSKIKTFSGGAKNDYNYGQGV